MTQAITEAVERGAGRVEPEAPVIRASERLWNLQWPTWTFGETTVSSGDIAEAMPFIAEHYPAIFPAQPGRWLEEKMTPAKRRFLAESDVLLFREGGHVIGVFVGNPIDWSTYYVRSIATLPDQRGRGLMADFGPCLEATLRSVGVERIEADTAPANLVLNRTLLGQGWMVTGTGNTERWGTLLRYTKLLTPEAERCFRDQFLNLPAPPKRKPIS